MLATANAPTHQAPEFPSGPYQAPEGLEINQFFRHIDILASQPARLRYAVHGLSEQQLEMRYRNWSVRQIVHHIADSTLNFYVRWKLAMTEQRPTIKPYNETDWARLPDSLLGEHTYSLAMFEATLGRLTFTARAMVPSDYSRTVWHPQYEREMAIWQLAALYAWHGNHHISQIEWLRHHYRW